MSMPKILSDHRRWLLMLLIGNGAAQAGGAIGTALLARWVFDGWINSGAPVQTWQTIAVVSGLIALVLAAAGLRVRERVDAERLGQDYAYCVRLLLFNHLSTLAPRTLQQRSRGGHLLRFIGDLTALRQWVSLGIARLSVAAVTAGISLLALTWISGSLAAVVALVLLIGCLGALLTGGAMLTAVAETRRRRARLAANINEKIATMPVVQTFGQENRECRRLARQSRRLRSAMIERAWVVGRLRGITEATNGMAVAGVLIFGGFEVAQGATSAGSVVAALTVLGMMTPALRDLGRVHEYWSAFQVSRQKIQSFLAIAAEVTEPPRPVELPVSNGEVQLRGVRFEGLFDNLQGVVEGGSHVAIVGANGVGKSSLFALLTRLQQPEAGEVLIDGGDLRHFSLASIRRCIGVVSPDLPLLRGTIEYNIRYRWRSAPAEEVARVCELCGVDSLVAELPKGLETRLSEGGVNLSLGQRQRIALARALLGNPKVLLLDEVDANLDGSSAALIDQILKTYQGTLLQITHRVDQALKADVIWHLGQGGVLECGAPDTLLSRDGPTLRLFQRGLRIVA